MRIEHIAMYVNDLDAVRDFFVKYFGATSNDEYHNVRTGFRSYFLSFSSGARLEIMTRPEMSDDSKNLQEQAIFILHSLLAAKPMSIQSLSS